MKQRHLILSVAIAAALAAAPGALLAQPASTAAHGDATQVTQPVNNSQLFTIPKSHFGFIGHASASTPLAGTSRMNHLQLILKPSALRHGEMEQFIANLHDPKSALFHHWLSPQQFGAAYGATDSDIAAVTSWLTSQGFTVNNVYPNKTQIDFSGTAAQVNSAFHTQETIYTLKGGKHLANATDIAIPAALKNVVAGVMGLSDFRPTKLIKKKEVAQWSATKKGFVSESEHPTAPKGISQAINFSATERGLAPNDMATIYGIKTLRGNGVTGQGINIAVVEDGDMNTDDWGNFVSTFNLGQYGGAIQQFNPPAPTGPNNCNDPSTNYFGESIETVLDAEWSTAIAPGANIWVATCSGYSVVNGYPSYPATTDNFFGGVYLAADNLINAPQGSRPDIISASYGYGEYFTDTRQQDRNRPDVGTGRCRRHFGLRFHRRLRLEPELQWRHHQWRRGEHGGGRELARHFTPCDRCGGQRFRRCPGRHHKSVLRIHPQRGRRFGPLLCAGDSLERILRQWRRGKGLGLRHPARVLSGIPEV